MIGFLDSCLQHLRCRIRPLCLEVRIFFPARKVLLDERLVRRPAVARREREVVVRVDTGDDAFGMILSDRVRRNAQREGRREFHLFKQPILQRLLVHRDVIAAPHG